LVFQGYTSFAEKISTAFFQRQKVVGGSIFSAKTLTAHLRHPFNWLSFFCFFSFKNMCEAQRAEDDKFLMLVLCKLKPTT